MLGTRSCLHLDIIRKRAHCVQKVADPWTTGQQDQYLETVNFEYTAFIMIKDIFLANALTSSNLFKPVNLVLQITIKCNVDDFCYFSLN